MTGSAPATAYDGSQQAAAESADATLEAITAAQLPVTPQETTPGPSMSHTTRHLCRPDGDHAETV
jgi:hypothetical protein